MDNEASHDTTDHDAQIDALWHEHRLFLLDLAFKMLGNFSSAEDVVQETFSRLLRVDLATIDDVRGWLVVVASRLCLDDLRSARSRRVDLGTDPEAVTPAATPDPADRVTLDDEIRMALVVVMQQLSPAERAVFILHDIFGFSFDKAAEIVGRTPQACRKLATRARQHIESDAVPARFLVRPPDEERVVERFIAACAGDDLDTLLELLDPDVVGEVDLGPTDSRPLQVGRDLVAGNLLRFFGTRSGIALVPHPLNGKSGALAFKAHRLFALITFKTGDGRITDIHAIADPHKLAIASLQFRPES
jgi:RNA polymerase sigma-70 factor (ECF subfamily)